MAKEQTDFGPEIRKELKKLSSKVSEITNDFWIDSLMELKGMPITKELVDGLAKIAKGTLKKEVDKAL